MPRPTLVMNAALQRLSSHSCALRSLMAASLLLSFCLSAFAQHGWIGTWASAPLPGKPDPALGDKTLRQIVHISVSGSRLRVRLSNVFGDQPLKIEDAYIAMASADSSIVASTDRQLRFHYRPFVIIPPGASFLSDALPFELPPFSDLTISLYLPSAPGSVTWHPSAHRTNFMADGDRSGARSLPNPEKIGSCYFLTGLTCKEATSAALSSHWVLPSLRVTKLPMAATASGPQSWQNVSPHSISLSAFSTRASTVIAFSNREQAQALQPAFERMFSGRPMSTGSSFSDDPINDLGAARPLPALDQLVGATERLIAAAHRHHLRFCCSTLTPYEGADYWTPAEEVIREHFNDFIRGTGNGCDAVIDQDRATHDPSHPARFLPAYDSGDHLHPNDAGHRAIAEAIDLSLFR